MYHRMLNDKFMLFEKAMLAGNPITEGYRHQIIGYASWISSARKSSLMSLRNRRAPRSVEAGGAAVTEKSSNSPVLAPQQKQNSTNSGSNSSSSSDNGGSTNANVSRSSAASHTEGSKLGRGFPFPPGSLSSAGDIPRVFPELRVIFDCGRNCEKGLNQGDVCSDFYFTFFSSSHSSSSDENTNYCGSNQNNNYSNNRSSSSCSSWKDLAGQQVSTLVRVLDAASAVIQSPLVPPSHE